MYSVGYICGLLFGAVLFAFIPAIVASKKGYSKGGFLAYGLFFFWPALIHSIALPDLNDSSKRKYRGSTLAFTVVATIGFHFAFLFNAYNSILRMYKFDALILLSVILSILAVFTSTFAREYLFVIIVFAAHAALSVINTLYLLFNYVGVLFSESVLMLDFISNIVAAIGFVLFVLLLKEHGRDGKKLEAASKNKFYIACALIIISTILPACSFLSYMDIRYVIQLALIAIFSFIGYFFLTKFYINDFTFRDIEAEEKAAAQAQSVSETQATPEI